jgi:hypothetical protein
MLHHAASEVRISGYSHSWTFSNITITNLGPNNDQLFVTTAHCGAFGGDASRQREYPDSGHLFLVDLSGRFRGLDRYPFAG